MQVFCPKCEDMYYPRSRFQRNLDGAYFGTTFPHLLLMSYPMLRPSRPLEAYQPRVFGFKLHASALRSANPYAELHGQGQPFGLIPALLFRPISAAKPDFGVN